MIFGKQQLRKMSIVLMMVFLYMGFILFTALKFVEGDNLQLFFRLAAMGLGLISIFFHRVNFSLFLFLVPGIVLYFINENPLVYNVLFLVVILQSLRGFEPRFMFLSLLLCSLLGVATHLYLYLTGQLSLEINVIGDRARYAMGFANPNLLALSYFSVAVNAIFVWNSTENRSLKILATFCAIASLPFIFYSDSRTFSAAICFLIMAGLLFKSKLAGKIIRPVVIALPFFGSFLTFYLTSGVDYSLDELLSSRPSYFKYYFDRASLWDFFVGWFLTSRDTVDNAYLLLLGAIGFPLALISCFWISRRMHQAFFYALPFLGAMLFISVFESVLIRPEIPVTILFLYFLVPRKEATTPIILRTIVNRVISNGRT